MFIDTVFIVLICVACYKGMNKGFILALFSFVGLCLGIAAAMKFSAATADYLSKHVSISGKWLPFLSFILVFALVVLCVYLLGKFFEKTTELILLGWLNKLGGILLYTLLYGMIFSVFLFYCKEIKLISDEQCKHSFFYPYLSPLAPSILAFLGKIIPFFKNSFEQLQLFFGKDFNNM